MKIDYEHGANRAISFASNIGLVVGTVLIIIYDLPYFFELLSLSLAVQLVLAWGRIDYWMRKYFAEVESPQRESELPVN